jgi:hypothetical protein
MGCSYEETNVPSGKTPGPPGLEVLKGPQEIVRHNGAVFLDSEFCFVVIRFGNIAAGSALLVD